MYGNLNLQVAEVHRNLIHRNYFNFTVYVNQLHFKSLFYFLVINPKIPVVFVMVYYR